MRQARAQLASQLHVWIEHGHYDDVLCVVHNSSINNNTNIDALTRVTSCYAIRQLSTSAKQPLK